jgi:hypothetical protein
MKGVNTMKKYSITTKFVTMYTKKEEVKVEYTNDFEAALGAYIIYIENPEVVFCTLALLNENDTIRDIVAAFNSQHIRG